MNISLNHTTPLKQNFKASLLSQMMQKPVSTPSTAQPTVATEIKQPIASLYIPVSSPIAERYNTQYAANSLMNLLLNKNGTHSITKATVNSAPIVPSNTTEESFDYKNNLRSMFQNNQAVIYALIPRTFTAKDTDNNGLIEGNERQGYFTTMVERLDELKTYGINTLHWLPINPPGKYAAKGNAGSVYAPLDYLAIDPALDDPTNPKNVYEEAKDAIKECHKRGIRVMVDLPSCMSVDLYENRPDLRATDAYGNPKTPEGWEDIKMFNPWADSDKEKLNQALVDYHKKFIDMCIDLGIDGIRADVGRAKPPEFWDIITTYARSKDPEFAFLAECYTQEDASPMKNMPADRPFEALKAGFDSYYGQYHIYNMWKATDFHKFVTESIDMTNKSKDIFDNKGNKIGEEKLLPKGKSLIGSFATHDDDSPMSHGGPDYCMMTDVLQTTLPMTNPYIITGYESGDRYLHNYGGKYVNASINELIKNNHVYNEVISFMKDSVIYAPVFESLTKSSNKNKTVAELENNPKYSNAMKYLVANMNVDKNEKFSHLLKKTQINSFVTNIITTGKRNFNIIELLNSPAANMKIETLAADDSEFKNIIESLEDYTYTKDSIKYYVHPQRIDIFNYSRQPKGNHPEIGCHFGYLMNCVRPKYGELITKGSYIELPVSNNKHDEVIAYARCKDGKTLVTIANHDVNSREHVKVNIPGLKANQTLNDIAPKYGTGSQWQAQNGCIDIDLGPAQAHIFEIDTPNLEKDIKAQNGRVLQQYLYD